MKKQMFVSVYVEGDDEEEALAEAKHLAERALATETTNPAIAHSYSEGGRFWAVAHNGWRCE